MFRLSTLSLFVGGALVVAARRLERVEVTGDSMGPALVAGDRLLVVRGSRARPGQVVTVADPRRPERLLVKRVASRSAAGVVVSGDNPAASTDSRQFGPVLRVRGRAVYRYHPRHRAGRLPRPRNTGGPVGSRWWPTRQRTSTGCSPTGSWTGWPTLP
ncbi:MAG: nickel-type superoxide dismutase maturation protease [Acidimicrobiales bacterium]